MKSKIALGSSKIRINLASLKNKVRGAFSLLTERRPSINPSHNINSMRRAAHAVNSALSIAKSSLSKDDLLEFETWVESQSRKLHSPKEIGVAWEVLGVLPEKIQAVRLSYALQQSLDAIIRQKLQLEDFNIQLRNVNLLIDGGDLFKASEAVEKIINTHDYSYWAIETKIALLFSTDRASDAKQYIRDLSVSATGLNAFHLYHFGMRNESSQSTYRFKNIVKRRIADTSLPTAYQYYVLYRSARILGNSSEELAAILSYELLTTKADLFLTSRRVALQIICNPASFSKREIALCRQIVCAISDDLELIKKSEENISLSNDLNLAVEIAIRQCMGSIKEAPVAPHVEKLAKGLAAFFSYSGSEADEDALRKQCLNYWWRFDAMMIESAQSIIRIPEIFAFSSTLENSLSHPINIKCMLVFESASAAYIASLQTPQREDLGSDDLWSKMSNVSSTVIDCIAVRDTWKALEDFEYSMALKLIQCALFKNIRLLPVLPLEIMFGGPDPKKIRSYGASIDLCNCLHRYTQINTDRKVKTNKRYAIEELIEVNNAENLIALATNISSAGEDKRSIEYFLASTCDVGTIELLGDTDGTIESLEIRAQLLRLASSISAESSAQLIAEADSITEQLQLDNVLQELDKTKVSVDEESLIPIVAREISGDFERYKKLKPDDTTNTSSVEELVISLKQQSASAFQIPKNEADDLLVQMIFTVLDRFIEDPVYGLEAIVGRRIRHGTISDELRGALEQVQLIGHRPRTGVDYKTPNAVRAAVENYDAAIRVGVNRAFIRFSSSIDNLVAILRDEVFYSRQPKLVKPRNRRAAVFELQVGFFVIAIARDAANISVSVENFIRELFDTFWFQLSASVERHRPQVGDFIASSLKESFSKLQLELKAAGYLDATFLAKIQRASEDLQLRGEFIKDWIRIPKISSEGKAYPLNMVYDAAMAFAKSKRPGFEPDSIVHIAENVSLDAHGFPIAFDAVLIAIDNIAKHSGLKKNRLDVKIELNTTGDKLCFFFESDMSKESWTRERATKLEAIKDDIRRHAYSDRAKRASESGIAKLATIVMQRGNCLIDFGPEKNNSKFKLYFELSYVAHARIKLDEAML
ncbi:MAG: hypothetical protein PHI55_07640 [Burkholderiaceae bacterium]|nr:hypothetical protein [Burkholderiaceae bacterium]